ncbi:MAG: zinc-binding dehydrogenase [Geothrix sp.]|uniref:zinc-binding dehydrogenase n=1 Tax=Geothrix sp. TaxID=1962974 RepID=UPI0017D71339|nr:zinc-binding dehydrogenase [Geothrix sp.]NWJ39448.1 zinc-binding dehydrogenase [Geothrix sp.]WIL19327.1 MAG: zinc-binding dehydrogenase [Geothrix sp.]
MAEAFRFRIREHGPAGSPVHEPFTPADPKPGWVRLSLKAMALNRLDLWTTEGIPGFPLPLPLTPGCDGAGVVEAVGEGTALPPGVELGGSAMIAPGLSCSVCPACLRGDDMLCPAYGILGHVCDGTAATHVLVPAANLLPIPGNWSFEQAAAFPLVFLTAWEMLVHKCQLRPGETVLVWGGGSGVGSAAIQLVRALGGSAIAVVGSEAKAMQCWDLGAEHVLVRGDLKSLAGKVRELTGKRGVDVVFEHTGAATWTTSMAACSRGGRIVTCGATTGPETPFNLQALFAKQIQIRGSYMGRREHLWTLLSLIQRNPTNPPFRPVLDQVFALEDYPGAQRHLAAGQGFGKVVCRI